jgi:oligoendopeptidase F
LKNISDFAESELNAIYINKKINDELRGFKHPYSATILGYQNDEQSIINFVNTVTKRFDISHRFYKLKANF